MRLTAMVLAGVAVAVMASSAEAAKRTYKVTPNRDDCYAVEYVPRTVEENTKGKLIRGESREWTGVVADGKTIRYQTNPSVYEKTVRIVEEEHYSLTPVSCSGRTR